MWDHIIWFAFCDWLISLRTMFSRLIHVVTCIKILFFFPSTFVKAYFCWSVLYMFVVSQSLSCVRLCDPMDCSTLGSPCPSPSSGVCSDSCPLSWWCHPTISSSVVPFSSCLLSFPASGSFLMSQLFQSGGQSIGASALVSVFPMNIQDWFPLGSIGLIFLEFKGLSRVFSNTMVQKHQFFNIQPSLWSSSHIHTWLLQKP